MKLSHFFRRSILLGMVSSTGILTFVGHSQLQAFEIPSIKIPAIEKPCIPLLCNPTTTLGGSDPKPSPVPAPIKVPEFPYITIKNQTRKTIAIKASIHLNGRQQPRPSNNMIWILKQGEESMILDGTNPRSIITDAGFGLIITEIEGKRIFDPDSGLFRSRSITEDGYPSYFVEIMNKQNDHLYIKEIKRQDGGFLFVITEPSPSPPQPWIFPIPNWL
jgi:hypothetical protein